MALDMNNFTSNQNEQGEVKSDRKLRIGIIGTGGIAGSHIASYKKQPDVEVVAGADLIPGKAEKFFKDNEVEAKAFTDYKEMIDTMNLDAVSVCTYNRTHAECTIYALEQIGRASCRERV